MSIYNTNYTIPLQGISKDNQTDRCPECYKKYRSEKNKEKYRKYNAKRRA